MKRSYFLILSILGFMALNAQDLSHCSTTEMMNKWMQENPEKAKDFLKRQEEAAKQDKFDFASNYSSKRLNAATVYTVPVVFHILHLNGPENISDAQVNDAMFILNRDFRKQNADTSTITTDFQALAADVNFEFRLASKDEYGNCTNGIVRHYDANTVWPATISQNYYAYTWDPSKYLNIYVVTTIGNGSAGYTFLPGSAPWYADAVVIRHDYVGSMGTSSLYSSRSLTHEVGHWFNLQHVWGLTNSPGVACGDDGVSDTPITKGHNWCNLFTPATCNPPIAENIQNYMEYSFCCRMFTIGQATRMNNCILSAVGARNNLYTNSNLIATGVMSPISPCAPKADFIANKNEVCVNFPVSFTDLSYNGTVSAWDWTFPGSAVPTSSLQNPTATFSVSGLKEVSLKVSNSLGYDSIAKKIVTVLGGPGSGINNIAQSFESISFPDSIWIKNYPAIGEGWIQTSTVAATGSKCVYINNYFDSPSDQAVYYSPMYDISSLPNPMLTFNYAYSQNPSGSADRLRVYYTTDCATNWNLIYSKAGSNLHTYGVGSYASGGFIPTPTQWLKEYVNLSALASANNLLFKFEFMHDSINPGNNIFMDDINVESITGVYETNFNSDWISVAPNPAKDLVNISFMFNAPAIAELSVLDVVGKQLKPAETIEVRNGSNKHQVNISDFAAGIYFIKININNNYFVKKLIVE